MKPEIKNELLLQVLQAWDPDGADQWWVDKCGELRWDTQLCWYMRWPNGDIYIKHSYMEKAHELVEFLLKDRPDLELGDFSTPYEECVKACDGGHWYSRDPWSDGEVNPKVMVARIKAYEYLREWKESQGPLTAKNIADGFKRQREALQPLIDSRTTAINPDDVTLSIDGQAIEGMACEWKCRRHPDEKDSEYRDRLTAAIKVPAPYAWKTKTLKGIPTPGTYETICPHCNGSKEVTGWYGKESCQACG